MSVTPTKESSKQRKLSDLRVIDLQRELRSFGVPYDKKDLKGVLVEKLRQTLVQRKLDPDLYLFDTSLESKSTSSEEMNRSHEENGSHETQQSETSNAEIDTDEHSSIEKPVQIVVTSPNNQSPSTATWNNEESSEPITGMDTTEAKQIAENPNDDDSDYLTIHPMRSKKEDENNNDEMDHEFTHQLQSSSPTEDELQISHSMDQFPETNIDYFDQKTRSPTTSTTDGDSQPAATFTHHEQDDANDEHQTEAALERTKDDATAAKSDPDQSQSSNDPQKPENNPKTNKDQCHLWVSNIAKETHASHLKELLSKHGKVLTTKVIGSSSSQWFGYITLATPDDVEKCIQALHQTELHGKKIYVDREMHDPSAQRSSDKAQTSSNFHSSHVSTSSHDHKSRSERSQSKSSSHESYDASRKRPASSSNETRKRFSTSEHIRSNEKSSERYDDQRRNSSSSQSSRYYSSRGHEKTESSRSPPRSSSSHRTTEKPSSSHQSRSNDRRSISSSDQSDHHRSSSIDKSRPLSHKYDKSKELSSKDHHHSTSSKSYENDRRSNYHHETRLRQEKEFYDRKHLQHQEEEKLKEEQRRLAEERERVKRQQELLERERLDIERTRRALEKEKQEQARELERQKRLADEAKHRQQRFDAKSADEKLHRIANQDSRRSRGSDRDSQRSYHSPTDSGSSSKGYNDRSPINSSSRGRNRPMDDINRDYYPEAKRSYPTNQREVMFRDRAAYPDTDLPMSSSSDNSNQRYLPSSSNQHRIPDPYSNLPPRGRDMDLPSNSSIGGAYGRPHRGLSPPPTSANSMPRRPHSRERYENQPYLSESDRRARSPPPSNKMRREPMDSSHWERPKPRDAVHYDTDSHKYMPNQYSSESSPQSSQQQGLWSSAPPSRQTHHHADVPVKHPFGWQHQSPPGPPSSHDRSRTNISGNQRVSMLPSSTLPPPPPPLPSSRGSSTSQSHLYNRPGVPVTGLSSSQQGHVPMPPAAASLHHTSPYLTQPVPPTGLVVHSTGQTRPYEPHYVVTQPLPPPQHRY